jgi:nucleoside-triphosphatase THEP1
MVYLLSQPVNSGKTTLISGWTQDNPNVAGILAPDIDHQRWLVDITSKERRMLSLDKHSTPNEAINIGRYTFSAYTFAWARMKLREAFQKKPNWLVFDEIGYLELSGSGLEPMVRTLLEKNRKTNSTNFIWVVRDQLRSEVIEHYQLSKREWSLWQYHNS